MELNTEKFITENDCGVPGFDAELFLHDLYKHLKYLFVLFLFDVFSGKVMTFKN